MPAKTTAEAYPASLGWIRGTFTLFKSDPLDDEKIKKIVTMGNPASYEFGPISQTGKTLCVIYRSIPAVPASAPALALCDDCLENFPLATAEVCPVCRDRLCPACRQEHYHDRPASGVMGLGR